MSRQLPLNPNLNHLRKQAKELLRELRQQDPALQLADAQHAIARDYGFASWPKLKAHVEPQQPASLRDDSPLVGRWKANLSKSRRHPANPFQAATIQIEVLGDILTITHDVVDALGEAASGKNTIRLDGNEHDSEHGNGYTLIALWRGSGVLEVVANKGGQIVGRGTYEGSVDGKSLTISNDEQFIVFDRVWIRNARSALTTAGAA